VKRNSLNNQIGSRQKKRRLKILYKLIRNITRRSFMMMYSRGATALVQKPKIVNRKQFFEQLLKSCVFHPTKEFFNTVPYDRSQELSNPG